MARTVAVAGRAHIRLVLMIVVLVSLLFAASGCSTLFGRNAHASDTASGNDSSGNLSATAVCGNGVLEDGE